MKTACTRFRSELERSVGGPRAAWERIAQDEHARACVACRAELAREMNLERLLGHDPEPLVPAGLSGRVLAALASQRTGHASSEEGHVHQDTDGLDELLERVPAPHVPADLAERVLRGVAPERRPPLPRVSVWLAVAAVVLAGLALWSWSAFRTQEKELELAASELEADPELLAYAVEQWELLNDADLDVWLASLDPLDELLLEYADGEVWRDEIEEAPTVGRPPYGAEKD